MPFIRDGLKTTNKNSKDKINSAKPLENVKILEVGCGAGILTEVYITLEIFVFKQLILGFNVRIFLAIGSNLWKRSSN